MTETDFERGPTAGADRFRETFPDSPDPVIESPALAVRDDRHDRQRSYLRDRVLTQTGLLLFGTRSFRLLFRRTLG
jgi:hypothetical protein